MSEVPYLIQAASYVKVRPRYPASLFERLALLTDRHDRAWDVGTGNGQAAVMVAEHYKSVVATDISEPQLSHALPHPNVTYAKLSATPSAEELERVVGAEGSVDLVTVAAALHWFDIDKFYPIVQHVLRKPGGVIAAWCYWLPQITPEIDSVTAKWSEAMEPYHSPKRKIALEKYKTIPFPFEPVNEEPERGEDQQRKGVEVEFLEMKKPMSLDGFLTMLRSGSTASAALDHGVELINDEFTDAFTKAWGPPDQVLTATYEIFLLVGTVSRADPS